MVDAVNTEEQATSAAQEQPPVAPAAPAAPDLNISDLAALRSIIDVASQRGAFKANELEAVGKTYNKLNTFLESVATNKEE
jgi:hypothetical protein